MVSRLVGVVATQTITAALQAFSFGITPGQQPLGLAQRQLGNIVPGVFTPVLAKHLKSFSLIDCITVGVDRMQRNFEPMRKQVAEK
jgi:hypothetical protein